MTTVEYTEGAARAIVRGDTVVLLPDPVDAELVDRVWAVLPDARAEGRHAGTGPSDGVVAVVGVLAQVSGTLTDIPPFAVATWDPVHRTARVAVRGTTASVVVATTAGEVEVTGADVLMWAERVVDDATSVDVRTAAADRAAPSWPLVGGVVRAAGVRRGEVRAATGADAGRSRPDAPDAPAAPGAADPFADPGAWPVPGQRTVAPAAAPPSQETIVGTVEAPSAPEPAGGAGTGPGTEPDGALSEDTVLGDDGDGYEHLFGDTVFRRVEDAAVRTVDEDEEGDAGPATGAAPPSAAPSPAPSDAAPSDPAPSAAAPSAAAPSAAAPQSPAPAGAPGLIAEVPGAGAPAPSPLAGTPAAASRAAAVGAGSPAGLPSTDEPVDEPGAPDGFADPDGFDDHDGHTIMSGELAALREAAGGVPQFSVPAPPGAQDVLALTCPQGHPNPPTREHCRTCRTPLQGDPHLVPRPLLGRILVSSGTATGGTVDVEGGQAVELDRDVVVGRRPRTSTTSADRIPRLVTVTSPQHDISRSHVEVTLEEWHVLVEDLATTNGTMLLRPGQEPRRLHPNQKEIVADGDVVELGDGVALTFEGIW
ncbi:FHA domain-containing protein [Isoptericola halotolerans]|uniref:FHA domain-containing protein n=1 Tax=Isoptericola halotolerans TaxID=300560 RepID=UPI00388E8A6D